MIAKEKDKRKKRKDAKYEIKPTIPLSIKINLERISFITGKSMKEIGEQLCEEGIRSNEIIDLLSQFFIRNYWHNSTYIFGNNERESLQNQKLSDKTERISLKLEKNIGEKIKELGFSLDVTPSKAAAILIDCTFKHSNFISSYLKENVSTKMEYEKVLELRKILSDMNKVSSTHIVSWAGFLTYLFARIEGDKAFVSEEVYGWIDAFK